jgi:glycosyltransferase involved in cell wall biosynthesis
MLKLVWLCSSSLLESHTGVYGSEKIERLDHLAREGYYTYLISAGFDKKRFEVLGLNKRFRLLSIPLKFKSVITPLLYGLSLFFFLPLFIAKEHPNFLISDPETTPFLLWVPLLSRILGFKTVLDIRSTPIVHGTASKITMREQILFRSSVWIAKTMYNGLTIVTPMMRDEVCNSFRINHAWTAVLSNGISEEVFSPERERRNGIILREQLGLSNKFVILCHGSMRLTGGLIESIKSMVILKETHPDIVLFLLGSIHKDVISLAEQTIKENGLEENVFLHEPVGFHEVPKYISMSDLGLVSLPNISFWRYQQPLKLLEYMAMEKSFVVSESPAHTSIVNRNKNAIYFTKVTPVEIATAIAFAYANKGKLSEWGKVGRDIVLSKYVWARINERFIDYLESVMLGRNGHAS